LSNFNQRGNRLAVFYEAASADEFMAFGDDIEEGAFDLAPIISS
jgi:hypothetical protein